MLNVQTYWNMWQGCSVSLIVALNVYSAVCAANKNKQAFLFQYFLEGTVDCIIFGLRLMVGSRCVSASVSV